MNSTSSPSPPVTQIVALELNGVAENSEHKETFQSSSSFDNNGPTQQQHQLQANIEIPTRTTSSSINFFLDHDDDLGFDPFAGLDLIFQNKKKIRDLNV